MAATYAVIARRRGPGYARVVALVNLFGTLARLSWMLPAAAISPAWRAVARDTLGWVAAHRSGLSPVQGDTAGR